MNHPFKNGPKLQLIQFSISSRIISSNHSLFDKMPKKNLKKSDSSKETKLVEISAKKEPIELDKLGNIMINVHCKPGSTSNMIKGEFSCPGQPRLDVKIHARAVEGQANSELVTYLAEILDVRRSDFTIIHGMKSREKTLSIPKGTISFEDVKDKIHKEIDLSRGKD